MAAFAALFRMAGLALSPAELMFVVGGLNLCGALATFTFAGLGVGESALAGLLMLLQFPTEQAVPVALVVRPAALVNTLLSSAIVDAIHRVERAFRPATKRTT